MQRKSESTVLITGASSGIGLELARTFASYGHSLVLVARNQDRLTNVAQELHKQFGVSVITIAKNLSQETAPQEIVHELNTQNIDIDILVNNAGFGLFGFFKDTDIKTEIDMINLNITALTALTKCLLPQMLKNKNGKILNVASTAAFQPGPLMAVYFATKAYVVSFSEALANELKGTGVSVTTLCPGPTDTGFQDAAKMANARLFRHAKTPAEVADLGYRGLMNGKHIVIPGFKNNFLAFLTRFAPVRLSAAIVRRMERT